MVTVLSKDLPEHAHPYLDEPFVRGSEPVAPSQTSPITAMARDEPTQACDLRHHRYQIGESHQSLPACDNSPELREDGCLRCGVDLETTPETMHASEREPAGVNNGADDDDSSSSSLSSWCYEGGSSDRAADDGQDEDDKTVIDSTFGDPDEGASSQHPEQSDDVSGSLRQRPDIDYAIHYRAFHALSGNQLATMPSIVRMVDSLAGDALVDTIKRAVALIGAQNRGTLYLHHGTRYLIEADWSRSLMLRFLAGLLTYSLTTMASQLEAEETHHEDVARNEEEHGVDWMFSKLRPVQPSYEGCLRQALKYGLAEMLAEDIRHVLAVRLWALSTDERAQLGDEAIRILNNDGDTTVHTL